MSVYDTTIILNPQIEEGGINGEIKKSLDLIDRYGGKVINEDRMGIRRLAYEIQKIHQGYYYRVTFEGTGKVIDELERQLRLDEPCLRFLTCLHHEEKVSHKKAEADDRPADKPVEQSAPAETATDADSGEEEAKE